MSDKGKPKRKVIQIAVSQSSATDKSLLALCDDGSLWNYSLCKGSLMDREAAQVFDWHRIKDVPTK